MAGVAMAGVAMTGAAMENGGGDGDSGSRDGESHPLPPPPVEYNDWFAQNSPNRVPGAPSAARSARHVSNKASDQQGVRTARPRAERPDEQARE